MFEIKCLDRTHLDAVRNFIGSLPANSLNKEVDYVDRAIHQWIDAENPSAPVLGAWDGGRLCGFMSFCLHGHPSSCLLGRALRVHPEDRRRGVARAILRGLEEHAAAAIWAPTALYLVVGSDNDAASQLFHRFGMRVRHRFQTFELACVTRTERIGPELRRVDTREAAPIFEWITGQERAGVVVDEWDAVPLTADELRRQAEKGSLFACGAPDDPTAVAVIGDESPVIRPTRRQVRLSVASGEGGSHTLLLALEEHARAHGVSGFIAHFAVGSLLSHAAFARGWRTNRWYQDLVFRKTVGERTDPGP